MIQHPMYGAGHKYRTLHLPISTTLAEVLDRVSGMFQYKKLELFISCQTQHNKSWISFPCTVNMYCKP